MDRLIRQYAKYYANPSAPSEDLLEEILNCPVTEWADFYEQVVPLYRTIVHVPNIHTLSLMTGGTTTGHRRPYSFGPFGDFWMKSIERQSKTYGQDILAIKITDVFPSNQRDLFSILGLEFTGFGPFHTARAFPAYGFQELVSVDLWHGTQPVLDGIYDVLAKHDVNQCAIIASGQCLRILLADESFLRKAPVVLYIHTDDDPCYTSQIHVNDQMIDWTSGRNFYTCSHGFKHVFPIFAPGYSLLNLTRPVADDSDYLVLGKTTMCKCGKRSVEINFTPHHSHAIRDSSGNVYYDCSLVDRLKTRFRFIQFVQTGHVINVNFVLYDGEDMLGEDRDIINEHFSVFNLRYRKNEYYKMKHNPKMYLYWQKTDDAGEFHHYEKPE